MLCNQEGRQFGNARLFAQPVFLVFRILASFSAPGAWSWAAWPGPSSSRIWVLAGGSAHKRKHREGFVVRGPNQGISVWGGQRDCPVDGSTVGGFIGAQRRACSPDWGVRTAFRETVKPERRLSGWELARPGNKKKASPALAFAALGLPGRRGREKRQNRLLWRVFPTSSDP